MRKVTALRPARGRRERVNLFLDGKFVFSLEAEVAAKEDLQVEQILAEEQVIALKKSDLLQRYLNTALRYLSYRPRSESELRERLLRCGSDVETLEAVVTKLRGQGLVDDLAFAQFWKDNRESFKPRSQRLTRLEMRRKGVSEEIIDQVVTEINDAESAYRASLSKARSLSGADYVSFRRRLGDYLRRRGFGYEVVSHTIERVWREREASLV